MFTEDKPEKGVSAGFLVTQESNLLLASWVCVGKRNEG
jgi:hypothetical protein